MIKFFRNIRRKYIAESRFGKYLFYAIGEIILVVIGILIALQINNLNEDRKSENDKQKLMFALKQEFLINKNTLEPQLLTLHKHNANLHKLVNFSAGAIDLPIDSLRSYASNLYYPWTLSMLNSVLEEAIAAGKFEMLSDSLKQKLSFLKDYTKSREALSKDFDNARINNSNEFTVLLLSLSAVPEVPEKFYVQEPIAMHPDYIKNDVELISLIKSPKTYSKLYQIYSASTTDELWIKYGLLRLTTESIDLIDKELKAE